MFEIGWSELLLIIIIAIILVNPKDVPSLIKNIKNFMRNFSSFKQECAKLFKEIEDEADIPELKDDFKVDFVEFSKEYLEPVDVVNKNSKKT